MSRQLSLFSYLKPKGSKRRCSSNEIDLVPASSDVDKDVKACVNKILEDVVNIIDESANKNVNIFKSNNVLKKNKTDYIMTIEKKESWKKDEKFKFWDTPNGKPISDSFKENFLVSVQRNGRNIYLLGLPKISYSTKQRK